MIDKIKNIEVGEVNKNTQTQILNQSACVKVHITEFPKNIIKIITKKK